jgi:hypothetical protein
VERLCNNVWRKNGLIEIRNMVGRTFRNANHDLIVKGAQISLLDQTRL